MQADKKSELVEIPQDLAEYLDMVSQTGMMGRDRHEVAAFILRLYCWNNVLDLHAAGACPSIKCRHDLD